MAGSLKKKLAAHGKVFCVVDRGPMIAPDDLPALGGYTPGGAGRPRYIALAGTGAPFADLFAIEARLKGLKSWHAYTLFATHEVGLATVAAGPEEFTSFDGRVRQFYAAS